MLECYASFNVYRIGPGQQTADVCRARKCWDQFCFLLARALQALSDPYRQSTCLSVCLFVRNFDAKYLGN